MGLATMLAIAALGGSGTLAMNAKARVLAVIAVVASAIAVATALGVVQLSIAGVSLPLGLGLVLAVVGAVMLFRVGAKTLVAAATVVTMAGVLMTLAALGV